MTLSRHPTVPEVEAKPGGEEEPVPRREFHCDSCGQACEGHPGGAGLFVWTRGDEVRYEEPPLCDECAERIALGAVLKWSADVDEEG